MTDTLVPLARLQAVRVLRARRVFDERRRAVDQARGLCEQEQGRLAQFRQRADAARREVSRTCIAAPVAMTRIHRMMDHIAAAQAEVEACETRLRRLRIVLGRLEEASREAWLDFARCNARQRALDQHADKQARVARRQAIATADDAMLEQHAAQAGQRGP
jgi:DNA repair ATPase RecN